jgi:hypothetical protein
MNVKTLGRGLIVAAAFFAVNAMADTLPGTKIAEMMTVKMIDTNKDGMVSKAEFLAMAGKAFDMKATEMKAKDSKLKADQYLDLLRNIMGQ